MNASTGSGRPQAAAGHMDMLPPAWPKDLRASRQPERRRPNSHMDCLISAVGAACSRSSREQPQAAAPSWVAGGAAWSLRHNCGSRHRNWMEGPAATNASAAGSRLNTPPRKSANSRVAGPIGTVLAASATTWSTRATSCLQPAIPGLSRTEARAHSADLLRTRVCGRPL